MTKTEIAVLIASKSNKQFDQSFLEMTEAWVELWRGKIIRQRLQEKTNEREYFVQRHIMKLERVSDVECAQLGLPEKCISKTVDEYPTLVRTNLLFDYVGAINFRNPFSRVNPLKSLYNDFTITSKLPIWTPTSKRIYIENYEGDNIGLIGIFANPSEISLCNCKKHNEQCVEQDLEYECPNDVIVDIINSILSIDLKVPGRVSIEDVKSTNEQ